MLDHDETVSDPGKLRWQNGGFYSKIRVQIFQKGLVDHPNKQGAYTVKQLCPFFLSKIPGMGQPKVSMLIKGHQINENDEVSLLKLFGVQAIANSFIYRR